MKEVNAYLTFDGNCLAAVKFYERCFGAELNVMPFSEAPGDLPKETKDRVMHARLAKNGAVLLMASDTMPGMPFRQGTNVSLSVNCESLEEIERLFSAVSENGKVNMP